MGITGTSAAKPLGENLKNSAIRSGTATAVGTAGLVATGAAVTGKVNVRGSPFAAGLAAATVGAPVLASSIAANATNFPHVLFDTGVGAAAGAVAGSQFALLMAGPGKSGVSRFAAGLIGAGVGGTVGTGVSYLNHVFMN